MAFHREPNTPHRDTVWGTCGHCKHEGWADRTQYNDQEQTVYHTCQNCHGKDNFREHKPTRGAGERGKTAVAPLRSWNEPERQRDPRNVRDMDVEIDAPPTNWRERIIWAIKRIRKQERKQEQRKQEEARRRSYLDRAPDRPEIPPVPAEVQPTGDFTVKMAYHCPYCDENVQATVVQSLSAKKKKDKHTAYCPICNQILQDRYKR